MKHDITEKGLWQNLSHAQQNKSRELYCRDVLVLIQGEYSHLRMLEMLYQKSLDMEELCDEILCFLKEESGSVLEDTTKPVEMEKAAFYCRTYHALVKSMNQLVLHPLAVYKRIKKIMENWMPDTVSLKLKGRIIKESQLVYPSLVSLMPKPVTMPVVQKLLDEGFENLWHFENVHFKKRQVYTVSEQQQAAKSILCALEAFQKLAATFTFPSHIKRMFAWARSVLQVLWSEFHREYLQVLAVNHATSEEPVFRSRSKLNIQGPKFATQAKFRRFFGNLAEKNLLPIDKNTDFRKLTSAVLQDGATPVLDSELVNSHRVRQLNEALDVLIYTVSESE